MFTIPTHAAASITQIDFNFAIDINKSNIGKSFKVIVDRLFKYGDFQ